MPTPTPNSTMKLEQTGLASVLKGHHLVVPANQRNYSWEHDQIQQYLEDLTLAQREEEPHFMGTLVTIGRGGDSLEVVDGQQRLATTTLLLVAIREKLHQLREDLLVEDIQKGYLYNIDRYQRERVPKLKLNEEDDEFFSALLTHGVDDGALPEPGKPSHELLLGAYKQHVAHVDKLLDGIPEEGQGDALLDWVSFLDDSAGVVLLKVYDDANAYRMFETLNDRGLKTSQADLVKNHLFGASGAKLSEVQNRWAWMRGALETLEEEDVTMDFLRYAIIAMTGPKREAQLYRTLKDRSRTPRQALTLATQLDDLAGSYATSLNSDHTRWNSYPASARKSLQILNLLNIRPMRSLTLAVTAQLGVGETSKSLNLLASLGVRLMIAASTRSAGVELPLGEAAKKVYTGEIETAVDLKRGLSEIVPDDKTFLAAFANARVANARLARYLLRSLERAQAGEIEPYFIPNDDEVINLEHVLPRRPDGNWASWSDMERKLSISRLGNQALMRASDNGYVKSGSFEDKRESYSRSPYALTACIAEETEWTPTQIEERQRRLAELAPTAWPI